MIKHTPYLDKFCRIFLLAAIQSEQLLNFLQEVIHGKDLAIRPVCHHVHIPCLMPSSIAAVGKTKVAYSPRPIHNPYMGLAPERYVPYTQEHTLVYANITWREIEPEKGEYQFDQIEEELHFDEWAEKGVTFIIRIIMDVLDATRIHLVAYRRTNAGDARLLEARTEW
ncbi:hypothetical protein [Brevibacillus daliensis]|uniref:hypothetical protein n=1 Tax=Brevibacillus daliensis TaxID=2892995 RepID=UPI001E63E186|nr:hypothetical protein [Brevibacillus daliensis]